MKPYSNKQIGKGIRELRIKSGLSKRQFAKFLRIPRIHLAHIERNGMRKAKGLNKKLCFLFMKKL